MLRSRSRSRARWRRRQGDAYLRVFGALATSLITLFIIRDKPVADLATDIMPIPGSGALPKGACPEDPAIPLPQGFSLQRNGADDSIRALKADDLSAELERSEKFRSLQQENSASQVAICFLQAYRVLFRLTTPRKELQLVNTVRDDNGLSHVKFRQFFAGLPIRNGEIKVHLTAENKVYEVEGQYLPTPAKFETEAYLSPDEAIEVARESVRWDQFVERQYHAKGAIFVDSRNRPRLAYQVNIYQRNNRNWEIWIDANNGGILTKLLTP